MGMGRGRVGVGSRLAGSIWLRTPSNSLVACCSALHEATAAARCAAASSAVGGRSSALLPPPPPPVLVPSPSPPAPESLAAAAPPLGRGGVRGERGWLCRGARGQARPLRCARQQRRHRTHAQAACRMPHTPCACRMPHAAHAVHMPRACMHTPCTRHSRQPRRHRLQGRGPDTIQGADQADARRQLQRHARADDANAAAAAGRRP